MFYFQQNRNLIIVIILAGFFYYLYWSNIIKSIDTTGNINNLIKDGPNINIVDLNKPLLPNQTYGNIRCRLSVEIYVRVTLCIHDFVDDKCI